MFINRACSEQGSLGRSRGPRTSSHMRTTRGASKPRADRHTSQTLPFIYLKITSESERIIYIKINIIKCEM